MYRTPTQSPVQKIFSALAKPAAIVYNIPRTCRCDGIGRRSGLKIHRWRQRTGSSPVTGTMSSVHNATEHSYVKEQSKGCSFTISMGRFAPTERLRLLHFFYPALPTRYSTATPWRLSNTTLSGYSSTSGISRMPMKL